MVSALIFRYALTKESLSFGTLQLHGLRVLHYLRELFWQISGRIPVKFYEVHLLRFLRHIFEALPEEPYFLLFLQNRHRLQQSLYKAPYRLQG